MVRIRLKRMGRTHRPFYRINAIDKRTKRDGRVLENLGWYNPLAPEGSPQYEIKAERVKHWLEHGAQPSDTVNDLLAQASIIDAEKWQQTRRRKNQKRYEASLEAKSEAEAAAKAEAEARAREEAEAKKKAEEEAKAAAEAPVEADAAGESTE
jgi:small subunit ribosomal protein S16